MSVLHASLLSAWSHQANKYLHSLSDGQVSRDI